MENRVNSVSFKANIKSLTKIKNKSKLVEANNRFKKATVKYPKVNLYITDVGDGEVSLHLSNVAKGKHYTTEEVFISDINKQIESLDVKELSSKFINIFKALMMHDDVSQKISHLKLEINRAHILLKDNLKFAEAWKADGRDYIANRYEVLATKNKERIESLTKELKICTDQFNKKLSSLYDKCKEVRQLEFLNF